MTKLYDVITSVQAMCGFFNDQQILKKNTSSLILIVLHGAVQ